MGAYLVGLTLFTLLLATHLGSDRPASVAVALLPLCMAGFMHLAFILCDWLQDSQAWSWHETSLALAVVLFVLLFTAKDLWVAAMPAWVLALPGFGFCLGSACTELAAWRAETTEKYESIA